MNGNPTASAKPIAWLAIPALPSCRTQTAGSEIIQRVYGNRQATASRWPRGATKLRVAFEALMINGPTGECKMRRTKLDRVDRRILRELQAEGRISNVELARRA